MPIDDVFGMDMNKNTFVLTSSVGLILGISTLGLPVRAGDIYQISSQMTEGLSLPFMTSQAAKQCLPCKPVGVGGIAYEYHSAAAGNDPHNGMPDHTHHFKMNQSPPSAGCQCFWARDFVKPTAGRSPLAGAIVVSPATGGGIAP
jgi:hypothetical protein